MNAETVIRAAESDGLKLALTDNGTVKCTGPRQMTERWAPQLRQYKAEILAALTASNDSDEAPGSVVGNPQNSTRALRPPDSQAL